jgi:hypothetical protein
MSSLVYPTGIKGLTFEGARTQLWKTGIQEAVSGKETRIAYQQYPRYRWELTYELLDHTLAVSEYKAVSGLIGAVNGAFDTFLYSDPVYNSVTDEKFGWTYAVGGTGGSTQCDGIKTQFQLVAAFLNTGGPGVPEIIQNLNGTPVIKDNGSTVSAANYTISGQGIVTFNTPPTTGHSLTWTGGFYYRCRFESDEIPFSEFMSRWYSSKKISFKSVIL